MRARLIKRKTSNNPNIDNMTDWPMQKDSSPATSHCCLARE
jgi:hypothetical protein